MKKYIILIVLSFISCHNKLPLDLKGGYFLDYESNGYICILNRNNSIVCNYDIIKINNNSEFIITEIKPINLIIKSEKIKHLRNFNKRKKFINKSNLKEYWIVDKRSELIFDIVLKKHKNVYGPFNKTEFLKKRNQLKISDTLNLLTIDEFLKR